MVEQSKPEIYGKIAVLRRIVLRPIRLNKSQDETGFMDHERGQIFCALLPKPAAYRKNLSCLKAP